MNISRKACAGLFGALLIVAGTATAWSQTAPLGGMSTVSTYSGSAKITAVDQANRTVTLAFADGRTATYKVGTAVQNLAQVSVGDTLDGAYEDRMSFVLSGPNTATPRDREVLAAVRAAPGQAPAGAIGRDVVTSWTVVSTNVSANTISLVNPAGGQVRTFDVRSPEGRAQLPNVKSGDKLTVISSELVVVAVSGKR
jgi:hypothetical protein